MVQDPHEIILDHLRRFDSRQGRFEDSLNLFGERLTSIERYLAAMHGDITEHRGEIDALKARLTRIEKRLELNDTV